MNKKTIIPIIIIIIVAYGFLTLGATFFLYEKSKECLLELKIDTTQCKYSTTAEELTDCFKKSSLCVDKLENSYANKLKNFNQNIEDRFWGFKE